ncbi:MAG TPA: AMP-binding protein [Candidatus Binatia bacterium]
MNGLPTDLTATARAEPRHLGEVFFQRAAELGDRTFIKLQRAGRFEEISWKDFAARVEEAVLGLRALGLRSGDRVAIIGENSVDWLCADLATLAAGLPNVVISPRLSEAMILRQLAHSGTRAVFVENDGGVGRLLNLKGQLPALDYLIVFEPAAAGLPQTVSFAALRARGRAAPKDALKKILEGVHEGDLATIMYTSGSTGEPKGVMKTQKNILSNIASGGPIARSKPEELAAMVLTMNHLLGRFGFQKSAATGRTTAVMEATELEVDLASIAALSPTSMTLVPRVMERIWVALLTEGDILEHWQELEKLELLPALARFEELKALLKQGVQRSLGGRIKYVTYSGAPMAPRIMRFFQLAGIPLLGSYGSTECGGVTLSGIGENRPGNLGKPFANIEIRIAGDGEILVRGPTVTPGYFENPEATREVLDADGWFHTGDLGAIEPDGSLRIIGRKKDVFYCSDGSNIYPSHIELLLENEPLVRQAVLVGDRRPFLAALIAPDPGRIAAELGKAEASLTPGEVHDALRARVERINRRLEDYEQVREIAVVPGDFPERVRSVTAFQKIKVDRKAVEDLYAGEIRGLYTNK